jgi:hypothetical protein
MEYYSTFERPFCKKIVIQFQKMFLQKACKIFKIVKESKKIVVFKFLQWHEKKERGEVWQQGILLLRDNNHLMQLSVLKYRTTG